MSNQKKLYALIVGINKYSKVRPLNQAVNDAKKINTFLEEWCKQQSIEYDDKCLLDGQATRNAIIKGFQEHLTQATSNDLVVFYFSGHGSQEEMDEVFSDVEHDGKLETIIAVDSRDTAPDIADKELRYLIHQVAAQKPHILCIFDCCHSGTNTRYPELARRWSDKARIRKWDDFIFSEKYKTVEDFKAAGGTDIALPEGEHVQIAACQNIELAYESSETGGFFTNALIKSLKATGGGINYYTLRQRIRYAISSKKFRQTPQIYVKGKEQNIFQPFLLGNYEKVVQNISVSLDKKRNRWIATIGALNGLPTRPPKDKYLIEIYDNQDKKIGDAYPQVVNFSDTILQIENEVEPLNREEQYTGKIGNLFTHTVPFYLDLDDKNQQAILKKHKKAPNQGISWVESEAQAKYVIRLKEGKIIITTPNDTRPLVKPLKSSQASLLLQYLDFIIKWEYALHLAPAQNKSKNPIEITIHKDKKPLDIKDKIVECQFDKPISSKQKPKVKLEITIKNTGRKTMYFTLVGFSHQFGVYNSLKEKIVKIDGRKSKSFPLPFTQPYYIQAHQWEYSPTWLKVFAVENPATDFSLLAQNELPEPVSLTTKRGRLKRRSDSTLKQEEWFVEFLEVRLSF